VSTGDHEQSLTAAELSEQGVELEVAADDVIVVRIAPE